MTRVTMEGLKYLASFRSSKYAGLCLGFPDATRSDGEDLRF